MIEILERKEPKKFEIICACCESKLSYTRADVDVFYSSRGGEEHYYIQCPVCKHSIEVEV